MGNRLTPGLLPGMLLSGCAWFGAGGEDSGTGRIGATDTGGRDTAESGDSGGGDDTGDGEDSGGDCGGRAPVIEGFDVEDGGAVVDPDSGDEVPALELIVDASDPDGDLDVVQLRVWVDAHPDGDVQLDSSPDIELSRTQMLDADGDPATPCATDEMTLVLWVAVDGRTFDYSTRYDWAVELADASGMWSAPVVTTATTPPPLD